MRVGLALHYVRHGKITGVERLGLSIAAGISELGISDVDLEVLASATAAKHLPTKRINTTRLPGDWRLTGEQLALPLWAKARRLDLLHIPAFGGAFLQRTPFVLHLNDTAFWDTPDKLSMLGRWYYRPLVERALRSRWLRATLYLSDAARDAALRHFPALSTSAYVCHCATTLPLATGSRLWHERHDGPVRILTVGTIEPRKNLPLMARAIDHLARLLGRAVHWRLVGRKGWASLEEDAVLARPSVEWLGVVDDQQLVELYQEADIYLSLSHLEGFNIPIIEAMSQGTPAVVSDIPVHREIAREGAVYAALDDPVGAAAMMHELVTDSIQWNARSEAAWRRGIVFTPTALAARVLDVYRASC